MADSLESLSKDFKTMSSQFAGFQHLMEKTLDKLSALESWRMGADNAFDKLIQQADQTVARIEKASSCIQHASSRIDLLESRLPPPPRAPTPQPPVPPRPPPYWLDLNLAPDPHARSSASMGERQEGHGGSLGGADAGAGILGPPPQ